MNEQQSGAYPQNWRASDYDPNAHMTNLKGRDYLNVQSRLTWFVQDQRALIVAGLAKMPYVVQSELVEMDRSTGWAHFRTTVRDVLGNEATMYGSEAVKDFPDFAEKASTKSLGRALLALGYGTAAAQELDEGERVVDTPQERPERRQNQPALHPQVQRPAQPAQAAQQPQPATEPTPIRKQRSWKSLRLRALHVGVNTEEQWADMVCDITGKNDAKALDPIKDYDLVERAIAAIEQEQEPAS